MHPPVAKDCMMKALLADFLEWNAAVPVVATSDGDYSETIDQFCIILKIIVCSLLWYKYPKMTTKISVTQFGR